MAIGLTESTHCSTQTVTPPRVLSAFSSSMTTTHKSWLGALPTLQTQQVERDTPINEPVATARVLPGPIKNDRREKQHCQFVQYNFTRHDESWRMSPEGGGFSYAADPPKTADNGEVICVASASRMRKFSPFCQGRTCDRLRQVESKATIFLLYLSLAFLAFNDYNNAIEQRVQEIKADRIYIYIYI